MTFGTTFDETSVAVSPGSPRVLKTEGISSRNFDWSVGRFAALWWLLLVSQFREGNPDIRAPIFPVILQDSTSSEH